MNPKWFQRISCTSAASESPGGPGSSSVAEIAVRAMQLSASGSPGSQYDRLADLRSVWGKSGEGKRSVFEARVGRRAGPCRK